MARLKTMLRGSKKDLNPSWELPPSGVGMAGYILLSRQRDPPKVGNGGVSSCVQFVLMAFTFKFVNPTAVTLENHNLGSYDNYLEELLATFSLFLITLFLLRGATSLEAHKNKVGSSRGRIRRLAL